MPLLYPATEDQPAAPKGLLTHTKGNAKQNSTAVAIFDSGSTVRDSASFFQQQQQQWRKHRIRDAL